MFIIIHFAFIINCKSKNLDKSLIIYPIDMKWYECLENGFVQIEQAHICIVKNGQMNVSYKTYKYKTYKYIQVKY